MICLAADTRSRRVFALFRVAGVVRVSRLRRSTNLHELTQRKNEEDTIDQGVVDNLQVRREIN